MIQLQKSLKLESNIDTATVFILLVLFAAQLSTTIAAAYATAAVYLIVKCTTIRIKNSHLMICGVAIGVALPSASTLNHGLTPFFYIAASPLLFLLAFDFSRKSLQHVCTVLRNVLWLSLIGVAIAATLNWNDPEPLGAIFPWASTNGFPSYLIIVQITYSIAFYLKNGKLPLLSSSATFLIAMIGIGRASIAVAGAMLLFSILVNVASLHSPVKRLLVCIAGLVSALGIFFYANAHWANLADAAQATETGSKLAGGLFDEHRAKQIADYIEKLDITSFFFGTSYDGTSIKDTYGGNPHNSYIRIHSFYGIFALLFAILPCFWLAFSRPTNSKKIVILILIGLALIRATTEPIFFPSILDFFYILYFLIYFENTRKQSTVKLAFK